MKQEAGFKDWSSLPVYCSRCRTDVALENPKTFFYMYYLCVQVGVVGTSGNCRRNKILVRMSFARGGISEGFWRHKQPQVAILIVSKGSLYICQEKHRRASPIGTSLAGVQ